jgi:hypothetical protein
MNYPLLLLNIGFRASEAGSLRLAFRICSDPAALLISHFPSHSRMAAIGKLLFAAPGDLSQAQYP